LVGGLDANGVAGFRFEIEAAVCTQVASIDVESGVVGITGPCDEGVGECAISIRVCRREDADKSVRRRILR
jgi:hypothetical protein